ncbi:MAG: HlyD family efflux transporter periplasmic adaptor subunit [Lentimicrobiaceae bacterium]|nr:HlyD family efflux transporter periplasmic adaptor subunit [Lentimicrobiaceae bacterium]
MKQIFLVIMAGLLLAGCKNVQKYDASGVFEATEIIVSSEGNGKILLLNIEEGQKLDFYQQVGQIDTMQLFLKKEQLLYTAKSLRNRRQDVNTQIAALTEQLATARREQARVQRLLANDAANQKQLDDANAQIAVLEKQIAAQTSVLEKSNSAVGEDNLSLEVQIAQIEDMLAKSKIVSPIAGTVIAKYTQQGEISVAGKPIFKVADLENMILRIYITSEQLTQLQLGQEISIFADFGKERRTYKGTISWISPQAEFTPKSIQVKDDRDNLVYAVKVAVKNDGYLKIGMYAEVGF